MSLSNLKVTVEKVLLTGLEQPHERSSGRYSSVSVVGGFLYVVGNMFTLESNSSLVGVLNVRERKWRWIPYPRMYYTSPRIFLYEDSLLMFSTMDWVRKSLREMRRFDLVLEQWTDFDTVTTGAGPWRRSYFSGDFLKQRKLFVVFGGESNGEVFDDVHILKVLQKKWVQPKIKGKRPEPRYYHGSCTYQGKIYYYGGLTREQRRCNDGLHVLTLTNGNTATWSTLKQIDLELSAFALVSIGRLLVFCGGSASGSRTGLRVYDTVAGELKEFPLERAEATAWYGLASFKAPFVNTIGLMGGKSRLNNYVTYVQLSVS